MIHYDTFHHQCNELEDQLFGKVYRENWQEKRFYQLFSNTESSHKIKLRICSQYYLFFQKKILSELHILLTPNVAKSGRFLSCGRKNHHSCDFLHNTNIFLTKTCDATMKIQSEPLNWNSQKLFHLLKCKMYGKPSFIGNTKIIFRAMFKDYKNTQKVSQQHFHKHYGQHGHNGIDDWHSRLVEQCETYEQLKKR